MNVSVRSYPLLLLAVAGVIASLTTAQQSLAQTSVATNPVGYIQETLTPSPNGTRTYSTVSFPLHQTPVFVGLVASVSGDTITLSGSIPSGLTASPYMVHIESSSNAIATGQSFLITAAGTNYVTVSSPTFTVQSILTTNDQVAIRGAETLGSVFGSTNSTVLLQGGSGVSGADVVKLWNGSTYLTFYYYTSTGWVSATDPSYTPVDNTVIYPDEGVMVGRISTNTLPATYAMSMGTVATNAQTALVNVPGYSFVSNPLPTAVSLSQFGFTNSPSWLEGESSSSADLVKIWNGTAWQNYYYYTNYGWVLDTDQNYTLQNNTTIPPGSAVMVLRQNADSVTPVNAYIPVALNYTP